MASEPQANTSFIILTGEPRIVAEFALVLEEHNRNFYILNHTNSFEDDIEQLGAVFDALKYGDMEGLEHAKAKSEMLNPFFEDFEEYVIYGVEDIAEDDDVDVIIDFGVSAVGEKINILQIFAEQYPSALILCSTLVCTATEVNSLLPMASQVIGFNGIPGFTKLASLELAPSLRARESALTKAIEFWSAFGFSTEVIEDRVALVMPRVLAMLINEAAFAVMENVASPTDIDNAMKLGVNYPKGLLEWADDIGLDIIVNILNALNTEYEQERYRTCVLLKQYVRVGWHGKHVGKGFYSHLPSN